MIMHAIILFDFCLPDCNTNQYWKTFSVHYSIIKFILFDDFVFFYFTLFGK